MKQYYVYILASRRNGTLYIGITNDLERRVWEHKHCPKGFTKEYSVNRLVYYEIRGTPYDAIQREKQMKKWKRSWKKELIVEVNPDWDDLFDTHTNTIRPLTAEAM